MAEVVESVQVGARVGAASGVSLEVPTGVDVAIMVDSHG